MSKYTWVPTHKAIAEKLLEYEHRQPELIQILKDAGETILKDKETDEYDIELQEIDPFTFFCYIYKYGTERRLQQLRKIASAFNISPLPEDELGIPSANAQKVWLFPWKKDRRNNEIERLWAFFKAALNGQITDEMLADILTIHNTGKTKITEAIFYVAPDRYLPINGQSKPYLEEVLNVDPDFKTWTEYERILQRVKTKTDDPFYKISHICWVWRSSVKDDVEKQEPDTQDDDKSPDIIGEDNKEFPLYEMALIETLSEIGVKESLDIYFQKIDELIHTARISPVHVHANTRSDSRIQFTLGQRYVLMLKRKKDKLRWLLMLAAEEEDIAKSFPGYDSSGLFSDGAGAENSYCWVEFEFSVKDAVPAFGELWEKWMKAAAQYYNEVKSTRLSNIYKRFTNPAMVRALFSNSYREFSVSKALIYKNYPVQKKLIERYKYLLKATGISGEEYKWKVLAKEHWDLEAEDFYQMVKKIPFKNLVYPMAISVLHKTAERFPVDLKKLMIQLFDDKRNLNERIKHFREGIAALYKQIEPDLAAHHDERTIASYLAFYDPEKYPIYKNSFYSRYCSQLNRRQAPTNEKYQDYIHLLDEFISKYIDTDNELIKLYDKVKPPKGFPDNNKYLLAQDILYRVLDRQKDDVEKYPDIDNLPPESGESRTDSSYTPESDNDEEEPEGEPGYWWLNANPTIWSISNMDEKDRQTYTSRNKKGNKRRIYKYFEAAQKGDLIIGYESSPVKQIKALMVVTRGLHKRDGSEVIEFEITEKLNVPIHWNELQNNPSLQECEVFRNNQGSLFKLTEEEFDIIREVIDEKNIAIDSQDEKSKLLPYAYENDPEKPFIPKSEFRQIIELLQRKKNIILQGPPGVGKTFIARKIAYEMMGYRNDASIEMVQFHQSFSYEDFIQGIRPGKNGFELQNGVFYSFCQKAHAHPDRMFFFIIDEINRGNLSKIFGELMMLIEHDKRFKKYALKLTYAEDELDRFYIPENLYIIGTMNTADRSLAIVDYALRRRFAFITLVPDYGQSFQSFIRSKGLSDELSEHIIRSVKKVNDEIRSDVNLGDGFKIGHSYFCTFPGNMDEKSWYNEVIAFEIKPLLEEIWFDDMDKVKVLVNELLF